MKHKILLINDRLDSGGVELVLQSVSRYLADRGENVTVWACKGSPEELREKYPAGIKWRAWPFWDKPVKRFSLRHFVQKLVKTLYEGLIIKLQKWDTVVAFKEAESMLLASKLRARRKLALVHTDYARFHWTEYCFKDNEAERAYFASFDTVAAVSAAAARSLVETIGDPGNVQVLYNPIDYARVEKLAAQNKLQAPQGKSLLVAVGRLDEVKRYDMLIDICHELSADFPLELWIVGGGELEEALASKLREENISCVKLLGKQANPYPYIAAADWLVSSSKTESYGLTIQEALILGVPVIACRCPAIEENMDESWGILCGMEKRELKAAVCRALSDRQLRESCAGNILKSYNKEALWEARLESYYRCIAGE